MTAATCHTEAGPPQADAQDPTAGAEPKLKRTEKRKIFWKKKCEKQQSTHQNQDPVKSFQLQVPAFFRNGFAGAPVAQCTGGQPAYHFHGQRGDMGQWTVPGSGLFAQNAPLFQDGKTSIQRQTKTRRAVELGQLGPVHVSETRSNTERWVNGTLVGVETSSVSTRTWSMGSHSMDNPSPVEVNTPASEVSDLYFPAPDRLRSIGAQFDKTGGTHVPPAHEGSRGLDAMTRKRGESSSACPVIVVTKAGDGDIVDTAEAAGGSDGNEVGADDTDADKSVLVASLPEDLYFCAQDLLQTRSLGIPRASTFPLAGMYHVTDRLAYEATPRTRDDLMSPNSFPSVPCGRVS